MALFHEFAIVPENYSTYLLDENIEKVSIPDDIICYIEDSLKWIKTIWNGKTENNSINYYGFSYISGENLRLLTEIIIAWKKLFSLSPNTITIKSGYLINEGKYEYHSFQKNDIISLMNDWIDLCLKAINSNSKIIHIGI